MIGAIYSEISRRKKRKEKRTILKGEVCDRCQNVKINIKCDPIAKEV